MNSPRRRKSRQSVSFFRRCSVDEDEASSGLESVSHAEDVTSPVINWRNYLTKEKVSQLVESTPFKAIVLLSILFNAVIIGAQTNRYLESEYEELFTALDSCCLAVAVFEIILKLYAEFWGFWKSGWNVFDFVVVTVSLIAPSFTFLRSTKLVRVIRVVRALRLLRGINVLPGLQIIVQTVLQSLSDMANIVLLLMIVMFIFAVLGVTFFGTKSTKYFGDLPAALFTLFICITQDGWVGIFRELEAEGQYVAAAIYFTAFIMIGAFVFANLVVAVVVTNLELSVKQRARQAENGEAGKDKPDEKEQDVTATVNVSELLSQHWRSQRPYEIPNVTGIRVQRLENYFLVLSAIEDNINRFKILKQELAEIVREVKEVNTKSDEMVSCTSPVPPTLGLPAHFHRHRASIALRGNRTGDLLSDMVMLDREKLIDSKNATVMRDLVRQTVTHVVKRDSLKSLSGSRSKSGFHLDKGK